MNGKNVSDQGEDVVDRIDLFELYVEIFWKELEIWSVVMLFFMYFICILVVYVWLVYLKVQ